MGNDVSRSWLPLRHAGEWTSWYLHLNNDNPGTDDGKASPDLAFAPGLEVGDFVYVQAKAAATPVPARPSVAERSG
jgi:hypothetical protein